MGRRRRRVVQSGAIRRRSGQTERSGYFGEQERYRRLFEVGPDAVFLVDCESEQILDANPAAVKLYGHSRGGVPSPEDQRHIHGARQEPAGHASGKPGSTPLAPQRKTARFFRSRSPAASSSVKDGNSRGRHPRHHRAQAGGGSTAVRKGLCRSSGRDCANHRVGIGS